MEISEKDRLVLRELAENVAEIASLPVHMENAREWARLNDLKAGRPMVWINELPWHQMDVDGTLELRTTSELSRRVEQELRQTIYQWEHLPCDMIVEPVYRLPLTIHDTGFGVTEEVDAIRQGEKSHILSRYYHAQFRDEGDVDKIRPPAVTYDEEATETEFQALEAAFGDVLPVKKMGIVHKWFAPWDQLIRWWGVEDVLADLVLRPAFVHQVMERFTDAYLSMLRQWQDLNLLSATDGNYRVGSGGLGYTDDLPQEDFGPSRVRPSDQWGCGAAQIFTSVSPQMHEEFALQYERRWMGQFGLNYYGCCDALHNKVDQLRTIPRLRKVSMSPRADVERMVENTNGDFVLSHKPNPAIFAYDEWDPDQARKELEDVLDKTYGCTVEVIMKDISTVRHDPQRLWDWARIAMETVEAR